MVTVKSPRSAVTIVDVARLAGVSVKTVSRVINHEPSVIDAKRAAVEAAIQQLRFKPNYSARNLKGARAYMLGLVYDNPSPSYIVQVQTGALQASQELDFGLLLFPCDYRNPALLQELDEFYEHRRLSGLILTSPLADAEDLISQLERKRVPFRKVVAVKAPFNAANGAVDDYSAAYSLAEHLIEQGHRRIGFIAGHPAHSATNERSGGFEAALSAHGLPFDRHLRVQGQFSFESGIDCGRQLLAARDRPTAIFASNDDMAAGALHVAHQMGIDVPHELSIAGFDDSPLSRQVWPQLTTVRQPTEALAARAVRDLVAGLRNSDRSLGPTESPKFEVVARASTGPVPGRAPR